MNKIGLTIGQNTGLNLNKYIKQKPDVEKIVTPKKNFEDIKQVIPSSQLLSSKKIENSKSISDNTGKNS